MACMVYADMIKATMTKLQSTADLLWLGLYALKDVACLKDGVFPLRLLWYRPLLQLEEVVRGGAIHTVMNKGD